MTVDRRWAMTSVVRPHQHLQAPPGPCRSDFRVERRVASWSSRIGAFFSIARAIREALALTAGKLDAVLADQRVVALWQRTG